MNTTNIIILAVLAVILIPALKGTITHMRGEGACCGGPKEKAPKKKIAGKPKQILTVHIEGMHCENCKNRVERALDEIDGVVAKVRLSRKIAKVYLYKNTDIGVISRTIEENGYKVVSVE